MLVRLWFLMTKMVSAYNVSQCSAVIKLYCGWMGSSLESRLCREGCCCPLIMAIILRTTHAPKMSRDFSGVTLRWRKHWKWAFNRPAVISAQALVLQWATLKWCWGPGWGQGKGSADVSIKKTSCHPEEGHQTLLKKNNINVYRTLDKSGTVQMCRLLNMLKKVK